MSTVTMPSGIIVTQFQLKEYVNQRVGASPFGGSEQAIDLLNDRWLCSFTAPGMFGYEHGALVEAFIGSLRGQVNNVALHHLVRPVPAGTVRGTLTLNTSAAQGASSIEVTGCSPSTGTLLQGDFLGVGGLLVKVATDCTAVAGVITVPITNRLRVAQNSGASVTWNQPTALFRMLSNSGVNYVGMSSEDTTFEFGEYI